MNAGPRFKPLRFLQRKMVYFRDVAKFEASKRVSSNERGIFVKCVLRLASFRGGARNDCGRSPAARLCHVIPSGSRTDFAGSIQIVGFCRRAAVR